MTRENIDLLLETPYFIGLTVQLGKLTPEDFVSIIREYGEQHSDRLILNSDLGRDKSDLFSCSKAVHQMLKQEINKKVIEKIAHKNAKKLFACI